MSQNKPVLGYILKGYPRISETFISNEILLLEKLGTKLHLFSMRHPREDFCHPSVKEIAAEVTYLPSDLIEEFPRLIESSRRFAKLRPQSFTKTLNYAGELFKEKGKTGTIKHFLQACYLAEIVLNKNINIAHLHGHFAHSPTSVTLFASMLLEIPFSFTAHAKDIYTSSKKSLQVKMERAEFLATCTGYNKEYLGELQKEINCPIHKVYHGINLDIFNKTKQDGTVSSPYKILTVARLTEKKGLPTLFKALKILKEEGVDFIYTLIGDGDDRESIFSYLEELGLQENLNWLGVKTHTEVIGELAKADVFALSSQIAENGDRDGVPNVLVESLAMQVPTISTNVSAIPELIHHLETGYLVEAKDEVNLAKGIKALLTDESLRKNVQRNGRKFVEEHFNNKVQTAKLQEVFFKYAPILKG
ncbi:MAG: glycosyltransferase [Desulfotalea sp.]